MSRLPSFVWNMYVSRSVCIYLIKLYRGGPSASSSRLTHEVAQVAIGVRNVMRIKM